MASACAMAGCHGTGALQTPEPSAGSGGSTSSGGTGATGCGTPPWNGEDNVPASPNPPGGLSPSQVPMFVTIGWDDNGYPDSMQWALDMMKGRTNPGTNACTYDGAPMTVTFFNSSTYVTSAGSDPVTLKKTWHDAWVDGHEIGNHTHSHSHGQPFTTQQWEDEIASCQDWLTKPFDPNETSWDEATGAGIPLADIKGFRTPFLEYNDALFSVLQGHGFWYDCSIQDGWHWDSDGTNYVWPYTLDEGSAGNELLVEWGTQPESLSPRPGLWEMPVHPVIVPPDDACPSYGCEAGLRAKLKAIHSWFGEEDGKITGFDYNLWADDAFQMNKAEVVATLKYTLDKRLEGNRAPMLLGAHTDYYSPSYPEANAPSSTYQERREAIEEFLEYAISKEQVRVVSYVQVLDWIRNPSAL